MSVEKSTETRHIPKHMMHVFSVLPFQNERTRVLTKDSINPPSNDGDIVYWMQRDMRVKDNWALLVASHFSKSLSSRLRIIYILPPPESLPQQWTERYVTFLYEGLENVHKECKELSIEFNVLFPKKDNSEAETLLENACTSKLVVCDFSPLKHNRFSKEEASKLLNTKDIPLYEVDAHNVVPVWHACDKRQVGARTIRPRINKLLPKFLCAFPELSVYSSYQNNVVTELASLNEVLEYTEADRSVKPLHNVKGGTESGMNQFQTFLNKGLKVYDTKRNDPNFPEACSSMSYWINFGHVSFQNLALILKKDIYSKTYRNGTDGFIEEGIIRRELSDNYVFYTPNKYDSLEGAAEWAQQTLQIHASDNRGWIFSQEEFESSRTHDDLWNAAQFQLVREGGMHGYMRMYWAKKILEWSSSPEVALKTAQYLNDKYALDGNDPNGFVGVGWSIMGIHDQGWKERDIFGKIRFMNYKGCKRKFKILQYTGKYPPAQENASLVLSSSQKETFYHRNKRKRKSQT